MYLLGCGKAKRDAPAPAAHLYTGSLFRAHVRWLHAQDPDPWWYILSAEHGILSPETVVEPYDRSIYQLTKPEREHWARGVADELEPMTDPGDEVTILAGRAYRCFETLIPRVQFVDPFQGLTLGRRLQAVYQEINP